MRGNMHPWETHITGTPDNAVGTCSDRVVFPMRADQHATVMDACGMDLTFQDTHSS